GWREGRAYVRCKVELRTVHRGYPLEREALCTELVGHESQTFRRTIKIDQVDLQAKTSVSPFADRQPADQASSIFSNAAAQVPANQRGPLRVCPPWPHDLTGKAI